MKHQQPTPARALELINEHFNIEKTFNDLLSIDIHQGESNTNRIVHIAASVAAHTGGRREYFLTLDLGDCCAVVFSVTTLSETETLPTADDTRSRCRMKLEYLLNII